MFEKFKSRKLIAAFLGALLPPLLAWLGGDIQIVEVCQLSVAVIVSYIFGQGYVDAKAAEANGGK